MGRGTIISHLWWTHKVILLDKDLFYTLRRSWRCVSGTVSSSINIRVYDSRCGQCH